MRLGGDCCGRSPFSSISEETFVEPQIFYRFGQSERIGKVLVHSRPELYE